MASLINLTVQNIFSSLCVSLHTVSLEKHVGTCSSQFRIYFLIYGSLGYRILCSRFILKSRSSHIRVFCIFRASTTQKRLVMLMWSIFTAKLKWFSPHQGWPSQTERKTSVAVSQATALSKIRNKTQLTALLLCVYLSIDVLIGKKHNAI